MFFFVLKLAMIQIGISVTQILMIVALEQFALSFWCFLKYVPLPRKNSLPDHSIFINLVTRSFPLMLTAVTVALYMRIDQFMLLHLINVESVAIYSFYIRFVEAGYIPLTILGTHYAPIINEYVRRTPSRTGLIKIFNHFLLIGLLITTLGIVIFKLVQSLIIPDTYQGYKSLFYYGAVLIPCIAVGTVSNQILVATDCTRSLVKRSLVAIALNITLNLILIPLYGISGALYASIATQVSVTFLATLLHQPTMNLLVSKK
jgi:O-antigen/teichoic acid export membrane protein